MKHLNDYRTYLLEAKTISDDSEFYQEKISLDLKVTVDEFLKNKKLRTTEIKTYSFNEKQFKITNLNLLIKLFRYKENVCNATTSFNKSSVVKNILIEPLIKLEIYIKEFDEDFQDIIDSTLLHELLHCYQYFNQEKNKKHQPCSWSVGVVLSKIRLDIKTDYVNQIVDLLYKSLRHEIAAQIHQYYFYKKRNKNYSKIFTIISSLEEFQIRNTSDDETLEIEKLRASIYDFISKLELSNKYRKDLKKSLWVERDINIFLQKLNQFFLDSSKIISNKIKQVDSKVEQKFEKSTIPTSFDRKDYLDFYYYDPLDILDDLGEIFAK